MVSAYPSQYQENVVNRILADDVSTAAWKEGQKTLYEKLREVDGVTEVLKGSPKVATLADVAYNIERPGPQSFFGWVKYLFQKPKDYTRVLK